MTSFAEHLPRQAAVRRALNGNGIVSYVQARSDGRVGHFAEVEIVA